MKTKRTNVGLLTCAAIFALKTATSAGTVIPVDGVWHQFTYPFSGSAAGLIAPDGPFTLVSTNFIRVEVTDFLQTGEWYSIYDGTTTNGTLLLRTPDVAFDTAPYTTSAQTAFVDGRFSKGEFILPPGTNTIVVRQEDILPGYTVWNLALRPTTVFDPALIPLTIEQAVQICFPTLTNRIYQPQWSSELDTNTWFNLGDPFTGTGQSRCVCDPLGARERRFYRVFSTGKGVNP